MADVGRAFQARLGDLERAALRRAERDTQRAFDGVAAGYARSNEGNRLLRHMRARHHL